MSTARALERGTRPGVGLSREEAERRLAADGPNELPPPPRESLAKRVWHQAREPMALLLLVAAAVDGVVLDETVDSLAITAIVILNAVIALIEEGRASRALAALRSLESPRARVRRDGRAREIPVRAVVAGDLVLLAAGDRVPADIRLEHTESVEVDESILTGESAPVAKDAQSPATDDAPLAERPWMAHTGTLVTRGSAEGVAVATGPRTELGRIAESLAAPTPSTPLQRELQHLTLLLGIGALVIATAVSGLLLVREGLTASGAEEAFLAGVALAVAAVPEGLATVTIVALALGVRRMARRGAIIRRLSAVETLGSTTVLATDKTGTLTENRMELHQVVLAGGAPTALTAIPMEVRERFAEVAALCSDAQLDPPSGDPIEIALIEPLGSDVVDRIRDAPRLGGAPFDSQRRRMTAVTEIHHGRLLTVKGAPEVVLERCTTAWTSEGVVALDQTARRELVETGETLAASGKRMLALAERGVAPNEILDPVEDLEHDLVLVALAALHDPVRPEARGAVEEASRAGIRLLMVTGDHPGTAVSVAEAVGLVPNAASAEVVTGRGLDDLGRVPVDPETHAVYARVEPRHKLALVDALHDRGEIVAMTGDGVNDAPALRAADIGVALGRSGSDVAREAGDMVITDDNLSTLVDAVEEGRGIYDNIRKVVDYLVASNLSEIAVVVAAVLLFPSLGVPLLPLQLLWINLLTDGLPALALGVDPVDPHLMARPPRSPAERMLGVARMRLLARRAAVMAAAPLAAAAIVHEIGNEGWIHTRTVMFTSLVLAQIAYAFVVRHAPHQQAHARNLWLVGSAVVSVALQALIVSWGTAHDVFGVVGLSPLDWLLVTGLALLSAAGIWLVRRYDPRP